MSGELIAIIAASVVVLIAVFFAGRKSGAAKEDEKLKETIGAMTEKVKESTAQAESAEKKSALATIVAQTVGEAVEKRTSSSVATMADIRDSMMSEQAALEAARKQAEAAKEFLK